MCCRPAWVGDGLSVLPIAQASVLRWVLMGGISTNQTCLAWPLPVVSWCQYGSMCLFVGWVLLGTLPGCMVCGGCVWRTVGS